MQLIKNKSASIIIWGIIGCIVMVLVESIIQPAYLHKSLIKVITFALCILAHILLTQDKSFLEVFRVRDRKQLSFSILLGVLVFGMILLTYYIFRGFINLDSIAANLMQKEAVSRDNFIYIAIYISIVNSFLEEVFFRGFLFVTLKRYVNPVFTYLYSAVMFALYHIFIMSGWFSFGVFILLLIALMLAGLIFDYLDRKGTVYNSWALHMFANLGINTIGFMMFGLIG